MFRSRVGISPETNCFFKLEIFRIEPKLRESTSSESASLKQGLSEKECKILAHELCTNLIKDLADLFKLSVALQMNIKESELPKNRKVSHNDVSLSGSGIRIGYNLVIGNLNLMNFRSNLLWKDSSASGAREIHRQIR